MFFVIKKRLNDIGKNLDFAYYYNNEERENMSADFKKSVKRAQEIIKNFELNERPVNLLRIINKEGLKIINEKEASSAGRLDIENKMIYIQSSDVLERKLFTIAHELGHWFLHKNLGVLEFDRDPNSLEHNNSDYEREANAFAAELLMPFNEVRTLILKNKYEVKDVANYFSVSYNAASNRVSNVIRTL